MNKFDRLESFEEETYLKLEGPRIGRLVKIDSDIWIDYQGNPFKRPLLARLEKRFGLDQLKAALELERDLKLEFIGGDPSMPVISQIYYSLLDEVTFKTKEENKTQEIIKAKKIVLDAEEIELKGSKRVIIRSGKSKIILDSLGRLVQKAGDIVNRARKNNKIKGGNIHIN